jgi:hypothetical protein
MQTWELMAREAVRQTMSAYNFGGDRGRIDELVATFAPDGSLQIGDDPAAVGHDAIQDLLSRSIQLDPPPRFVHHHVASVHFRAVSSESIEVSSYFAVLTDAGLDHWGRYRDRFAPFGDRWLIAERQAIADGFAASSCFRR